MIHSPSPFTATMKLAFTCPSGFRSAISSALGSVPAPRYAAASRCGEKARRLRRGIGKLIVPPCSNPRLCRKRPVRCAAQLEILGDGRTRTRATSESPLAAARETCLHPASAHSLACGPALRMPPTTPLAAPGVPAAAAAARAAGKPGIGRAIESAWRIASRVKSCTNCGWPEAHLDFRRMNVHVHFLGTADRETAAPREKRPAAEILRYAS